MLSTQRKISRPLALAALVFPLLAGAQSSQTIGELFASESTAQGPVLLAGTGMSVASGAELAAGKSVATLRLERGGEVRICPNGNMTVSAAQGNVQQGNQELMFAMNGGSVEIDYPINDLADTFMTPDFKLMLAGPGVFHFALGVNGKGDTCVKPMRGNSAGIIVSEMIGSAVYQVKPDEAVLFAGGKLSGRGPLVGGCGCPRPPPVMRAEEKPPQPAPSTETRAGVTAPRPEPAAVARPDLTAPPPSLNPDATRVQVEAPLLFRGDQPAEPVYAVARIHFSQLPNTFLAQESSKPVVLKPGKGEVSAKSKENKGFFGRVKGFFAALFHK